MGLVSLFGADNNAQLLQNGIVFADGQDNNSGRRSKNFIRNRSAYRNTNGWSVTGTATVTRTTTASEIVDGVASLKFAAGAAADYVKNAFTINNIQKGVPLNISFDFITQSGVGGDWDVQIFDVTAAVLISVAMPSQGGNGGNIPGGNGTFNAFFVASTNTSYELRIVRKGSGGTFTAANFDVFQQQVRVGAISTDLGGDYTTTASGNITAGTATYTANTLKWQRLGDSMRVVGNVRIASVTTAPSGSIIWINLPAGYTRDDSKFLDGGRTPWGTTSSFIGGVRREVNFLSIGTANSSQISIAAGDNATLTLAAGDELKINFTIPISQFAANTQLLDRVLEEFAYNTDTTTTASVTGSGYANGATGVGLSANFSTLGTTYTRRVQFQTAIQPTDRVSIETDLGSSGAIWVDMQARFPDVAQGTNAYGVELNSVAGTTFADVSFNKGGFSPNNATYAGNGTAWSAIPTYKWRVRKVSSGAQIAGAISTANIVGRIDGNAPASGYIGELLTHKPAAFTGGTTRAQIATLTLTPGVWMMSAVFSTSVINVAVGGTAISICISTTSGNSTAGCTDGYDLVEGSVNATSGYGATFIPSKVVSISASTTYYLNGRTDHTTAADMVASLSAVRIA